MDCPRCGAHAPEVAHYCQVCGQDLRTGDLTRRRHFAVKPDEPVASFALISSIMPRGAAQRPQTYRVALTIALAVALIAAIFGALPIAVLVAAFAVPVVYIVYLYDVNLWEDEPVPVVALAFGLTGVLALAFTLIWTSLAPLSISLDDVDGVALGGPTLTGFLIVAILVPIIGEAIRQIGPVLLAGKPQFDDLMDGLTFGVVSGVAYACFDTLVRHWALLTGGIVEQDPGHWASLIFLEGFVKPLVMGTATGLACAEFSGLGRGFDGFTPRYFRAVAIAVLANVAYQSGAYIFAFVGPTTLGVTMTILWGLLIIGVLILRIRTVLHTALMEAALEHSARTGGAGPSGELGFCASCEMPLLADAAFCNACGTATRVRTKDHKPKDHQPKERRSKDQRPGAQRSAVADRSSEARGNQGPVGAAAAAGSATAVVDQRQGIDREQGIDGGLGTDRGLDVPPPPPPRGDDQTQIVPGFDGGADWPQGPHRDPRDEEGRA